MFLPAAGNRNGTSLNNAGSNAKYWSRTLNADNPNNAYNLNFNSDDVNVNNNRNNGHTVRPVRSKHLPLHKKGVHPFYLYYQNISASDEAEIIQIS
ncbi:hypothetical protein C7Y71_002190 [Pseudoprevotella muciniphila]|uniref:Uncharacterized protein n=1 Tax=Pseudoprevotella muciniphila TaxID=2133944 RepID=A0A5P8E4H4_9BACT|nr:hypothetical protein [Pseudoprevotella muciniphila]QFQ11929.1 hypothetical protein C7Y71_002190 [Pseudoprevotella muciniphila]